MPWTWVDRDGEQPADLRGCGGAEWKRCRHPSGEQCILTDLLHFILWTNLGVNVHDSQGGVLDGLWLEEPRELGIM